MHITFISSVSKVRTDSKVKLAQKLLVHALQWLLDIKEVYTTYHDLQIQKGCLHFQSHWLPGFDSMCRLLSSFLLIGQHCYPCQLCYCSRNHLIQWIFSLPGQGIYACLVAHQLRKSLRGYYHIEYKHCWLSCCKGQLYKKNDLIQEI